MNTSLEPPRSSGRATRLRTSVLLRSSLVKYGHKSILAVKRPLKRTHWRLTHFMSIFLPTNFWKLNEQGELGELEVVLPNEKHTLKSTWRGIKVSMIPPLFVQGLLCFGPSCEQISGRSPQESVLPVSPLKFSFRRPERGRSSSSKLGRQHISQSSGTADLSKLLS